MLSFSFGETFHGTRRTAVCGAAQPPTATAPAASALYTRNSRREMGCGFMSQFQMIPVVFLFTTI
jgi:hypothetical protein